MKGNTRLRQESIKKVLCEIREKGPISKRALQEITGFSWGNISSVTSLLINAGYIESLGKQETSVGRKPEEVDINTNDNYIIGIDFNSQGTLVAVCDLKGRIINKYDSQTKNLDKDTALETLYRLIETAINENKTKNIISISIAMQGVVDTENGVSVRNDTIKGWENVNICELLYNRFNKKVLLFHDPDCILYAERYFGHLSSQRLENAVLVRVDHGTGIAAMLSSKIYMGTKKATCEIGPSFVPYKNTARMLSDIINYRGIEEAYKKVRNTDIPFKEILNLALNNDTVAMQVIKDAAVSFAYALHNVYNLFNPEKIIIFSSKKQFASLLIQEVVNALKEMGSSAIKPVMSNLDYSAAAMGAALFAADNLIDDLKFE